MTGLSSLNNKLVISLTATAAGDPASARTGVASGGQSGSRDVTTVDISPLGRAMSEGGKTAGAAKNQDIDDSSLSSEVKRAIKRIRELKEDLAEQQAALRDVMVDASLDDEARATRVAQIQSEIGTLTGALDTATRALGKLLKDQGASPADAATALALASR